MDVEDDHQLTADEHNATKILVVSPINLPVMILSFQDITYHLNDS